MDTEELQLCMKKICPAIELNVFPANRIPIFVNLPVYMISNLDPDSKPGSHWIAMHIDIDGNGEYFDSFGRKPSGYHKLFLKRNAKKWFYNHVSIQNHFSSVCGEYCLVYINFKFNGRTMFDFLSSFSENTICNDLIVKNTYTFFFKK